jgi:polar amino acid transport system substrate-binding protein
MTTTPRGYNVLAALFMACAGILGMARAHADATLDKIEQRGKIVVGVSVAGPPFGSIDPATGKNTGYNVELAQSVARHLGVELETVAVTPANRIQFLQQGRVDLLISNMQLTEERAKVLSYVPTPYDLVGGAGLVAKASGIRQWTDVKGKPVCVSQGSNYTKPLQDTYGADVKGLRDGSEADLALRGGNCVASVHDGPVIHLLLTEPEWKDYTVIDTELLPVPSVIWTRKGEADTMAKIDAIVRDWYKTGELVQIARRNGMPTEHVLKLSEQYAH